MRILVAVCGLVATLGIAGSAGASKPAVWLSNVDPVWSPDSSHIAFVARGAPPYRDSSDIWVMRADGSDAVDLTPDATNENTMAWSPDGRRIAFVGGTIESWSVEVVDSDGGNRHVIAHGAGPAWSPDSRRLAYAAADGLRVIDADGGDDNRVTAAAFVLFGFPGAATAWSPDGQRIAYVDSANLWIVDADGADRHPLTTFRGVDMRDPRWSPDGSTVAFVHNDAYRGDELRIIRPDGGGLRLIGAYWWVGGYSWTPDGRAIYFAAARAPEGVLRIYRAGLGGSAPVAITNQSIFAGNPAVAPDGAKIAFNVANENQYTSDIWTLDLRTGARRNLTGSASTLSVDARMVKPPDRLVIAQVQPVTDSAVRVDVRDAHEIIRNAVVTVKSSPGSLVPVTPIGRTGPDGSTEVRFRPTNGQTIPAGTRVTLTVVAHPPGSYSRAVVATKRVAVSF